MDIFIANLRSLMEKRGIKTQTALANVTGIKRVTINNWFKKKIKKLPEAGHLSTLAKFFGVDVADLLHDTTVLGVADHQSQGFKTPPENLIIIEKAYKLLTDGNENQRQALITMIEALAGSIPSKKASKKHPK